MKYITTIATMLAILAIPSTASAYSQPSGTFCSTKVPGDCYATSSVDVYKQTVKSGAGKGWGYFTPISGTYSMSLPGSCWYKWNSRAEWQANGSPSGSTTCVYVGGDYVTHEFGRYLYPDIPDEDKDEFNFEDTLTIAELQSEGHVVDTKTMIRLGDGTPNYYFCQFYSVRDSVNDHATTIALDRTPPSIYEACEFILRQSDPAPGTGTGDSTDDSETIGDQIIIPSSSARCGSVKPANDRVVVRSTRLHCNVARGVLARYARKMKSPAGWTCTAIVNDRGMRARCNRKGRSGKSTAYGAWVR